MTEPAASGVRVSARELIRLRLQARAIDLDSQRRASAMLAGQQQSRFRGRGVDFQESRAYQPGDDIRTMDWRVTARTGRPHTKVYQEERERPIMLVVDCNPSMFFATRVAFKAVIAARLAALIGWAAVNNNDRVGAFLFGPGGHHDLPPSGGRGGAMKLIRLLVDWIDSDRHREGIAGLGGALERLRRVIRPGSLLFVLSDFYALDESSEHHLARLRQHNDVLACQIVDALELAPPPPGRYGISDGRQVRMLDTADEQLRARYSDYFRQHHARIHQLLRRRAVPLLSFATHDDIAETLRRHLAPRRRTA